MNKLKFPLGSIVAVTYGWSLYVSYWARPTIVWHKMQKLEWEAYIHPSDEIEKEIQAWKKWKQMTFLEQVFSGPPRKSHKH